MAQEKKQTLKDVMNNINKKFGAGTVTTAAEAMKSGKLTKRVIPTPSLEVNNALYGGFSGIVELYGPHSSGKTSIAIDTIVKAQKADPKFQVAWLETEGSITDSILIDHGVDPERLVYWNQEDVGGAENALDVSRALVSSGEIQMIVINSLAGLSPKTEVEDDLSKQNIGLLARLMSKYFKVINGELSKNNVCCIVINQVRDKVGVLYGSPETTTGGRALAFYASQRVRMSKLTLKAEDPIKDTEGVKISCSVTKNRFASKNCPFMKCEYYALFAYGIDSTVIVPQLAEEQGVVIKKGAHWYYTTNAGKELHFTSKNNFIDELRSNESLKEEIISKLGMSQQQSDEEISNTIKEQEKIDKEVQEVEQEMDNEGDDFVEPNE